VVAYSNAIKHTQLKVPLEMLETKGAVSEATAEAMASGACKLTRGSKTRIAVSITGVAGPGGGTSEKPVGNVCFAWAKRDTEQVPQILRSESRFFDGDRNEIRQQSVFHALKQMVKLLRQTE
jgi:nicotinamide-nucleotide amidase